MGERTQELIYQIGRRRDKLSPAEERGEAAAMKELGERLGMTGFESGGEDKESRLEEARELGQDPGSYFSEIRNQLDHEVRQLEQKLREIETESPPVVYPKQGEDFATASERLAADKRNRAEVARSRLEQLSFDRSRADDILKALEVGESNLAREDLGTRIDRIERELVELDRQVAEVEGDVRYTNLMEHSASARKLADQARKDWPNLAAVHEQVAKIYAKQAAEIVDLDKLKVGIDSRSQDIRNFRAMIKNLELYKKQ